MLSYQKAGSGFPVVLLHGFCENNTCFNQQVLLLKNHFTIITPTLPGTTSADFPLANSIEKMADDVFTLLASLDINKCVMLGHSMGGYVTLSFAKKYAHQLVGFGLLHSTALADDEARKEKREQTKRVIETKGAAFFASSFIPTLFAQSTSDNVVAEFLAVTDLLSDEGLIAQVNAMKNRPDHHTFIKETRLPVFWAIGKYDTLIPEDVVFKQALLGDMAYIAYLTNSSHMGHAEQPQELANHIIRFCNHLTD